MHLYSTKISGLSALVVLDVVYCELDVQLAQAPGV